MEMQQATAVVQGAQLRYELAGAGPPLVLIHGFALDMRMWDDQMAALAASHRVLRYDLRGFGQSPPPDAPYAHVDDLKALLEYLDLGPAVIAGLSLGGGIALDFALAYPAATAALILVDAIVGGYHLTPECDASLGAVYETGRRAGVQAARAQCLAHPLFAAVREQPQAWDRIIQMVAAYSGWHWVQQDPARFADPPALDRLSDVAAPTLVVVGEREIADFRAIADVLAMRIPYARQEVIPGSGHMTTMENSARFNFVVQAFLAEFSSSNTAGRPNTSC